MSVRERHAADKDNDSLEDNVLAGSLEQHATIKTKLKTLKTRVKEKTSNVLHSARPSSTTEPVTQEQPTDRLINNPAFDPSSLAEGHQTTPESTFGKVKDSLIAAGKAVANPKRAIQQKAASKLATGDRPYLSQQADEDYIDAHADLTRCQDEEADSSSNKGSGTNETESRRRIKQLEEVRDARKVAWTTAEHMQRVAVFQAVTLGMPSPGQFTVVDRELGEPTILYRAYLSALNRHYLKSLAVNSMGQVDQTPQQQFDQDVCIKYLERILVATSSWQSWFLSMRKIYRYENPRTTLKWAAIWFFIWYMDYTITFIFGWVVYITLDNRFGKQRAEHLRRSVVRARNGSENATRLSELVRRHGSSDWLEPLIEEAGPIAQMYLADSADFLEILANFYDWQRPAGTWKALFWFVCAILLGALTPAGYSLKIVWMFCLLAFFLSRPIASRHPQYRHTVNAIKWIFWDVPTDADWSLMYLRRRADETRMALLGKEMEGERQQDIPRGPTVDASPPPKSFVIETSSSGKPLFDFKTRYKSLPCRLQFFLWGISVRAVSPLRNHPGPLVEFPWAQIREIRKATFSAPGLSNVISTEGLELFVIGKTPLQPDAKDSSAATPPPRQRVRLKNLANRDKVFNLLIGLSGLTFQVLPPLPAKVSNKPFAAVLSGKGRKMSVESRSGEDSNDSHDDDDDDQELELHDANEFFTEPFR
ncbi:hypothetical protein ANO11243_020260 [Dothideomycetidae sp. 11243]|nr:hypothetical protein ANO11243_020260 [fungal sp. No.11243]